MINLSGNVKGVKELAKALDQLGQKAGGRILANSLRAAAKVVTTQAESSFPKNKYKRKHWVGRNLKKGKQGFEVYPPFARTQIRSKVRQYKNKQGAYALVGVTPDAFYALQFVELGTSKQAKQPWLVPAFTNTSGQQIDTIKSRLGKDISKEAQRQAARNRPK